MLIEPTICQVRAVLSEWDGTQGLARSDNGSPYTLHADQLEAESPDRLHIGQALTLNVRFNAQGEQEFLAFRPLHAATPEPSFSEHALRFNHPRLLMMATLRLAATVIIMILLGWAIAFEHTALFIQAFLISSTVSGGLTYLLNINKAQNAWQANADGVLLGQGRQPLYLPWRDIGRAYVRRHRLGIGRVLVLDTNRNGTVQTTKLHLFLLSPSDQNTLLNSLTTHCPAFQAA